MVESNNMNKEPQKAELYFSSALRTAIAEGDAFRIKASIEAQNNNSITEAISNRLVVRSFLLRQKYELSHLDESVADLADDAQLIIKELYTYLINIDDDFEDTFFAKEDDEKFSKLTGDEHMRAALSEPNEAMVKLARQLAELDVRRLTPPEKVYDWMQNTRDGIVERLWESVQDVREAGATGAALIGIHRTIEDLTADLDKYIIGSLPR